MIGKFYVYTEDKQYVLEKTDIYMKMKVFIAS